MAEEQEKIPFIVLRPRRMAMLFALFVRPSHGLLAMQFYKCWVPALLCILVLLGMASCRRAFKYVSDVAIPKVDGIMSAVAPDVTPMKFSDNGIEYPEKLKLPYSRAVSGWQIDIVKDKNGLTPPESSGAMHGIVVSEKSVFYWMTGKDGKSFGRNVMDEKQLDSMIRVMQKNYPEGLDEAGMKEFASMLCMIAVPAVSMFTFASIAGMVLVTFLMFVAALMFLRPEARHNVSGTLVMVVNCLLPPTLISTFWSFFVPLSFDYSHIFLLASCAYLLLVFIGARKGE